MIYDATNWTRCGRPRKGDKILHPKTRRHVGTIDAVRADGTLLMVYAPRNQYREWYGTRAVAFIPEHYERLFERGVLVIDRPE